MSSHRSLIAAACCISLLWAQPVAACINMYGTDLQGKPKMMKEGFPDNYVEGLMAKVNQKIDWKKEKAELEEKLKSDSDYKIRNDYAAALIFLGETKQAIEILLQIEKEHPGLYMTASNLGTAYELNGDLENAITWIKEGIVRNEHSHYGTEWLHVKILEAKQNLAEDPDWLASHSVLGADFGIGDVPVAPSTPITDYDGEPLKLENVHYALQHQLRERLQFVNAPNPIVADLLFDLGNVLALKDVAEPAIPVYEFAMTYGAVDGDLIESRLTQMRLLVSANPQSGQREGAHLPDWIGKGELLFVASAVTLILGFGISAAVIWTIRRNRRYAKRSLDAMRDSNSHGPSKAAANVSDE